MRLEMIGIKTFLIPLTLPHTSTSIYIHWWSVQHQGCLNLSGLSRVPGGGQDAIYWVLILSHGLGSVCWLLHVPFCTPLGLMLLSIPLWAVRILSRSFATWVTWETALCCMLGLWWAALGVNGSLGSLGVFKTWPDISIHSPLTPATTFLLLFSTRSARVFLCTEHFQWWSDLKMYQGASSLLKGINQRALANFRHFNLRRDTFPEAEIKGKLINFLHVTR